MSPIEENKSILKEMADRDLPFTLVERNTRSPASENFENVKIKAEPEPPMPAYTCSFCSEPFEDEDKLNGHTLANHLMPLNLPPPIIPTNNVNVNRRRPYTKRKYTTIQEFKEQQKKIREIEPEFKFTPEQVENLEGIFKKKKFINVFDIERLQKLGKYPEDKVQEWFKRRRGPEIQQAQPYQRTTSTSNYVKCKICSEMFNTNDKLREHMERTVHCFRCKFSFKNSGDLDIHNESYHGKDDEQLLILSEKLAKNGTDTTDIYTCEYCDKKFKRSGMYQKHVEIHLKSNFGKQKSEELLNSLLKTGNENRENSNSNSNFRKRPTTVQTFTMSDFGSENRSTIRTGPNPRFLPESTAKLTERGQLSFNCHRCKINFRNSADLKSHFMEKHSGMGNNLSSQNQKLLAEIASLKSKNREFLIAHVTKKSQNQKLNDENASLKSQNEELLIENAALKAKNLDLMTENLALKSQDVNFVDNIMQNPEVQHITDKIFDFLDKKSAMTCRLVSKSWNQFMKRPIFWLKQLKTMDENVYQSWKVLNQQLDASDVNENDFILILMKCVHQKPEYPIELAAKLQNYNLDNDLIDDYEEEYSNSPLSEKTKLAEFFLEHEDINRKIYHEGNGLTPIHLAIKCNFTDVVKILIPKYEKPFVPTENGKTLIHLAVISGNLKFLEILGDFFDDLNTKDNDGQTPIEIAQYLEDEKMIEFLEKSVKCDYCSTKFKRLSSKQRHTKNIHGITDDITSDQPMDFQSTDQLPVISNKTEDFNIATDLIAPENSTTEPTVQVKESLDEIPETSKDPEESIITEANSEGRKAKADSEIDDFIKEIEIKVKSQQEEIKLKKVCTKPEDLNNSAVSNNLDLNIIDSNNASDSNKFDLKITDFSTNTDSNDITDLKNADMKEIDLKTTDNSCKTDSNDTTDLKNTDSNEIELKPVDNSSNTDKNDTDLSTNTDSKNMDSNDMDSKNADLNEIELKTADNLSNTNSNDTDKNIRRFGKRRLKTTDNSFNTEKNDTDLNIEDSKKADSNNTSDSNEINLKTIDSSNTDLKDMDSNKTDSNIENSNTNSSNTDLNRVDSNHTTDSKLTDPSNLDLKNPQLLPENTTKVTERAQSSFNCHRCKINFRYSSDLKNHFMEKHSSGNNLSAQNQKLASNSESKNIADSNNTASNKDVSIKDLANADSKIMDSSDTDSKNIELNATDLDNTQ